MDFSDIDQLPKRLLLQLSAKAIRPYATELRSRLRSTANELKQLKAKLSRTEQALKKARGACKRMSSNAELCGARMASEPTPGSAAG